MDDGGLRIRLLDQITAQEGDGARVEITGTRQRQLVALLALAERAFPRADVAQRLYGDRDANVRRVKDRLPGDVKRALGSGTQTWDLRSAWVDEIDFRRRAFALAGAGDALDRDELMELVELGKANLLPGLPDDLHIGDGWVADQRKEHERVFAIVLRAGQAWSATRDPELARSLMRMLRTEETPPGTRLARFRPPPDPIEYIPDPDRRPWVGREAELSLIASRFTRHSDQRAVQVIHGPPGLGKTALAHRYAMEHRFNPYELVFWIRAEHEADLRDDLRTLALKAGIASADPTTSIASEDEDALAFVRDLGELLGSSAVGRWLLVFDNVERSAAIKPFLDHLRWGGDILITSQAPDWTDIDEEPLELRSLPPHEAVKLLSMRSGQPASEAMEAICERLDGRPLLLLRAADVMLKDGESAAEYLNALEENLERALRASPWLDEGERGATATYERAIDAAVDQGGPGARTLFQLAAFMAPEPVTDEMLDALATLDPPVPELADRLAVGHARYALRDRSLIVTYPASRRFEVHRLDQAIVRRGLADDPRRTVGLIHTAARVLRGAGGVPSESGLVALGPLGAHVEELARRAARLEIEDEILRDDEELQTTLRAAKSTVAELISEVARYRRTRSEWAAAEAAHRLAVELSADDAPEKAALRGIRLANVLRQRGKFEQAQDIVSNDLPTVRRELARTPDLAFALTVQARIYRARADNAPAKARAPLEEAVQLLEPKRPGEPPERPHQLSRTYHYLSVVLRQLGHYDAAENVSKEGLALLTTLPPEHEYPEGLEPKEPLIATHLRAIATVWRLRGDLAGAIRCHATALNILKRAHSPDHTDVGRCHDSLGRALRDYGRFEEALHNFERAQEISDLRFGGSYPHAATALVNQAITLRLMGDLSEARRRAEHGVKIYRDFYEDSYANGEGRLHNSDTAWGVFVLAECRAEQGELDAAEADHRAVLRLRREKSPRGKHAHIASSLAGLGDVYAYRGSEPDAKRLHAQARKMRADIFGDDSNYWVAQSDERLGQLLHGESAREHTRSALAVYEQQLAPDHPWIARARARLRELA